MTEQAASGFGVELAPSTSLSIVPDPDPVPTDDWVEVHDISSLPSRSLREAWPVSAEEEVTPSQLRAEMLQMVADIEFRLKQTYEIQLREAGVHTGAVYAEDVHSTKHQLTGYVVSNNTGSGGATVNGSIAWSDLHVVFLGVDYTISNGFTANRYAWFIKPASGTTATLTTGPTLPDLGPNDALIFVNDNGTARNNIDASIPPAVQKSSLTLEMLGTELTGTGGVLTALRNDVNNAQATADGSIVSYYQPNPPWAAGTTQPAGVVGDIWYDSDDGGAFRWTGTASTPNNSWVRIADTSTASIAALAGTKITTYVLPTTTPPTAPTGGAIAAGDIWIVTDLNNQIRVRNAANNAWTTLLVGDAGLATGISGSKIGAGISGDNVTQGTVAATRVGAGVQGAVLNSATGSLTSTTQIGSNTVRPANMNFPTHMLY